MFNFLYTYQPEPIALAIGSFVIHWYGLLAALGLFSAWFVIEKLAKKYDIKEDLFPLFLGSVIAGLIGARLYHVVNELPFYMEHLSWIPQVWKGGLALHGGVIGVALYLWYWLRKEQLSLSLIADIFATGGILIQIFGRFGNYFNQELFGRPTELPWGIPIEPLYRPEIFGISTHFHPVFIYEAFLNAVLFIILLTLHKARLHGKMQLDKGYLFLIYLLCYSIIRGSLETIRVDATPIIGGMRLPIIVSLLVIITTLGFLLRQYHAKKNHS